jgi:hypothetical protein
MVRCSLKPLGIVRLVLPIDCWTSSRIMPNRCLFVLLPRRGALQTTAVYCTVQSLQSAVASESDNTLAKYIMHIPGTVELINFLAELRAGAVATVAVRIRAWGDVVLQGCGRVPKVDPQRAEEVPLIWGF